MFLDVGNLNIKQHINLSGVLIIKMENGIKMLKWLVNTYNFPTSYIERTLTALRCARQGNIVLSNLLCFLFTGM
jgi:hypothetical protein